MGQLSAILAWNEFVLSFTLLTDDRLKTVPVGLASFFGEFGAQWDMIMTASVVATIPTVVPFLAFQKGFIGNLTAGSVK